MTTRELARLSLLTALTAVATMIVKVPTPATKGYVNLGDSMVFVSALLFGAKTGAIAGGLGSSLADLLGGYLLWAPMTLFIKGVEGLLVGKLFSMTRRSLLDRTGILMAIPIILLGGAWMLSGYFICETQLFGWGAALGALPGNTFQEILGLAVSIPTAAALTKVGLGQDEYTE